MYQYEFPRPGLTVDLVITCFDDGKWKLLMVKRANDPWKDHWALPGGYVEEGESLEDAAKRELQEETGVTGVRFNQIGAFGDPKRDPRGWTVTVAFAGSVPDLTARAGDDAKEVMWYPIDQIVLNGALDLGFDHREIITAAFDKGLA